MKIRGINISTRFFTSLSFNGIDEYVTVSDSSLYSYIQNTGIFTISLFLKFTDFTAAGDLEILGNNSGTTAQKGIRFVYQGTNDNFKCVLTKAAGGNPIITSSSSSNIITDNNFHHIVLRGNGTDIFFNVDNIKEKGGGIMDSTKSTGNSTNSLGIGRNISLASGFLNGELDEILFTNTFVSDIDLTTIFYRGRFGPDYSDIDGGVSHWNMNNFNPIDIIGGHNGTGTLMDTSNEISEGSLGTSNFKIKA